MRYDTCLVSLGLILLAVAVWIGWVEQDKVNEDTRGLRAAVPTLIRTYTEVGDSTAKALMNYDRRLREMKSDQLKLEVRLRNLETLNDLKLLVVETNGAVKFPETGMGTFDIGIGNK